MSTAAIINGQQAVDDYDNDLLMTTGLKMAADNVAVNVPVNAFGNMVQAFGVPANPFNAGGLFGTAPNATSNLFNFNLFDFTTGIFAPPLPGSSGSTGQQTQAPVVPTGTVSSTPNPYSQDDPRHAFWNLN